MASAELTVVIYAGQKVLLGIDLKCSSTRERESRAGPEHVWNDFGETKNESPTEVRSHKAVDWPTA
jgi:hypothetical protein